MKTGELGGSSVASLFLSFDGRVRRRDVWVCGFALTVVASIVTTLLVDRIDARWLSLIISSALFVPVTALLAKRMRDRGKEPWRWVAIYLGPAVILTVLQQVGVGYYWRNGIAWPTGFWPNMLSFFALTTGLAGAFDALLLWPRYGTNEHGPDPREEGE